jgi:hypothetical protein
MSRCDLCDTAYDEFGDGWDGLCPSCADKVSEHMDEHGCDREVAVFHISVGMKHDD